MRKVLNYYSRTLRNIYLIYHLSNLLTLHHMQVLPYQSSRFKEVVVDMRTVLIYRKVNLFLMLYFWSIGRVGWLGL